MPIPRRLCACITIINSADLFKHFTLLKFLPNVRHGKIEMILIEKATEKDAQTLTNLGIKTFVETFAKDNTVEDLELYLSETFSNEKQLAEIRDPNRFIYIARLFGEPTGFLHLSKSIPDPTITGENPIELLRLYVDSRWHGKGVAAALMEKTIQIAKDSGHKTLWLGVWEQNFRARAFYKKYGFEVVGQHIFKLGTDEQVDLLMSRDL